MLLTCSPRPLERSRALAGWEGRRRVALVCATALTFGCQGVVRPATGEEPEGPGGGPSDPSLVCDEPTVELAPLTHLTRAEYDRAASDLLGFEVAVGRGFAADDDTSGYEVGERVSPLLAEQYADAAEALALRAAAGDLPTFVGCESDDPELASCARAFIRRFGRRVFRRTLTDAEVEGLFGLYEAGAAVDYETGFRLVIQGLLASPSFLYHVEERVPSDAPEGETVALDDFAVASRLSFFLWGSAPDDELLDAAAAGRLTDPAELEAQARRMLAEDSAREGVRDFARQWLGLEALDTVQRDPERYPGFDRVRAAQLRRSVERFVEESFLGEEGGVETLMLGSFAFFDESLAEAYGAPSVSGDELRRVELDPGRRAGLLTQPGLLTVLAKPNQSDPIHRGLFVRTRLLCQHLPPPPDDIAVVAPDPAPGLTTRERFAEHSSVERCRGCHQLMDPIGFGFEQYDAVGQWRDTDEGAPVDASGQVYAAGDAEGPFNGVPELAAQLAASDAVRECVALQVFRYAVRRTETEVDACAIDQVQRDFRASGYDLRELMVAVVRSDAFRYQPVPAGVER